MYYENRIPELQLTNENLNEDMERLLEDAELDEAQEKKLEREFARQYHLITREERLETIAGDLVRHFVGRGFPGKAMVISIDKATAVRMYDKVQAYWKAELSRLMDEMAATLDDAGRLALNERLEFMEETDMAVVVSSSQNEIEEMKAKGLDIVSHRKRMISEDLETKFKDPDDPFRIVFVCAMWLTGFDAPSCSTLYLDKPMRNHTLMQTIARANRVFKEKVNGLIVDYVGVFRSLEQALTIYGAGGTTGARETPVKDKAALVALLQQTITEMEGFCTGLGVELDPIQAASGFDQIKLLDDAVEAIIVNDESKKGYLTRAATIWRLYKAILPDAEAKTYAPRCLLTDILAKKIRALAPPADITDMMAEVEALKEKFAKGKKRTEAEKLKGQVNGKLKQMLRLNRTRMDYLERFQKMIDEYNAGSLNIDEFFQRLMELAKSLNEEEKRGVAEQLSEKELALFDILTKPSIELSDAETKQVKKAARDLLDALKRGKLLLDWRKFQQSRAAVKVGIEDVLDEGLPERFAPELFQQEVEAVYQHVFDFYYGGDRGIYAAAP